ncbi:ATP-binding protein [Methylobacterium longum]|uniref:histidine kinase n=2 Tax=Methylobacterium TaxID=407 RepID=A0ABT8AKX0_9HYPH|nr:sensor histidine kinase [Methylobacterium longum]MCJ2102012.1 sensor histidine kinase [Methylobacterium sp. E-046]MDN3570121.1 sensor histidine kinase [Methylobacterium longum]
MWLCLPSLRQRPPSPPVRPERRGRGFRPHEAVRPRPIIRRRTGASPHGCTTGDAAGAAAERGFRPAARSRPAIAPPGRVGAGRIGGAKTVTAEDTGPGLPPGEPAEAFPRFYRSGLAREASGNGLRLSLVVAIAKLHTASVTIRAAAAGGCRIDPVFPHAEAGGLRPMRSHARATPRAGPRRQAERAAAPGA